MCSRKTMRKRRREMCFVQGLILLQIMKLSSVAELLDNIMSCCASRCQPDQGLTILNIRKNVISAKKAIRYTAVYRITRFYVRKVLGTKEYDRIKNWKNMSIGLDEICCLSFAYFWVNPSNFLCKHAKIELKGHYEGWKKQNLKMGGKISNQVDLE